MTVQRNEEWTVVFGDKSPSEVIADQAHEIQGMAEFIVRMVEEKLEQGFDFEPEVKARLMNAFKTRAKELVESGDFEAPLLAHSAVVALLPDDLHLAIWRHHRDTWLEEHRKRHLDDLYIEARLKDELPGWTLASRAELGPKNKGEIDDKLRNLAEKEKGEVRFHYPTKQLVVCKKFPGHTKFARWIVRL